MVGRKIRGLEVAGSNPVTIAFYLFPSSFFSQTATLFEIGIICIFIFSRNIYSSAEINLFLNKNNDIGRLCIQCKKIL